MQSLQMILLALIIIILDCLISPTFSGSLSIIQFYPSTSNTQILSGRSVLDLKDRTMISVPYVRIKGRIILSNPLDACESIEPPPTSTENWILLTKLDDCCGLGRKITNAAEAGYQAIIAKNTGANDTGLYWVPTDTASSYGLTNNLIYVGILGESDAFRLQTFSYPSRYYVKIKFEAERTTVFYLVFIGGSFSVVFVAGFLFKLFFLNANVLPQTHHQMYPIGMERYHRVRRVLQQKITGVRLHQIPVRKWSLTTDSYSNACAICLCEFSDTLENPIRVFHCCHAFHASCIDPWILKEKTRCPVCMENVFSKSRKLANSSTFTNTTSDAV